MTHKHTAYLIDVASKTIRPISIDPQNSLTEMYTALGCDLVCTPVTFANGDTLWADDEAMIRSKEPEGGIMMKDWAFPILGNCLITGVDYETGECRSPRAGIQSYFNTIGFLPKDLAIQYKSQF